MAAAIFQGNYIKLLKKALRMGAQGSDPSNAEEGDIYYNSTANEIRAYNGTTWDAFSGVDSGAVQLIQAAKTDTFTTTSTSFTDITGLSVTITPTSVSSKILIIAMVTGGNSTGADYIMLRLMRDSTEIGVGDAAGSRPQVTTAFLGLNSYQITPMTSVFMESPATVSSITYKVQCRVKTGTGLVNRNSVDSNDDDGVRCISSLTVLEFL